MVEDLYLIKDVRLDKLKKFLLMEFSTNARDEVLNAALKYKGRITTLNDDGPAGFDYISIKDDVYIFDAGVGLSWLPTDVLELEKVFTV